MDYRLPLPPHPIASRQAHKVLEWALSGWCVHGAVADGAHIVLGELVTNEVRHEAPCRIPGAAGRNSEGGSWVRWLTWIRKVKGTIACQETSDRVQAYEARRCGTRVIWRKLDCLKPNLQKMQRHIRRKDA